MTPHEEKQHNENLKGKFMLIDGHSLLYRAFHALPVMTTSTGQHTNAVYGLATMLMRLLDTEKPDYIAVAFDKSAPTFRHTAYAAYKAQRPKMPDELRSQIPLVREMMEAFNLPIREVDGYEADDCIGSLATSGQALGLQVVIVTGDKDALQLVKPGLEVLITRKGITEMDRFDSNLVEERLGVKPTQVVDLKALMGDVSDNIPGVAGIGQKTAARLLQEYGHLDAILESAADIKGKIGEALRTYRDDALLSRALATIDTHAPVDPDIESLQKAEPDVAGLTSLFTRIEARGLLAQLAKRYPKNEHPALAITQASLLEARTDEVSGAQAVELPLSLPGLDDNEPVYEHLHLTQAHADVWTKRALDLPDPLIAVAALLHNNQNDMQYTMYAVGSGEECVISNGEAAQHYIALLRSGRQVIGHDMKQQILAAARAGGKLLEPEETVGLNDLQVASYLVNPSQGDHSLADVAVKHGYAPPISWPAQPFGNLERETTGGWRDALAQRYHVLKGAAPHLIERLQADGLTSLYRDLEMPLLAVLAHMEHIGIAVDKPRLAGMSTEMASEVERLTAEIYAAAGEEFNINSPKQLAGVLFNKLQLPVLKSTKTGPSTSVEVLEELATEHQLPRLLIDYRQLVKLTSTYVDALPQQIHPQTGRIHTTFNQTVAATGRLSSTNPNLQNIPVRTAQGRQIRGAFVPATDCTLISADYSQIELRVLAHLAQDSNLLAAFREGADKHTKTAAEVFGVTPEAVTSEMRSDAKAINFGIVYGISSFGLARGTGLSRSEAQAYIKGYFARYPGVKRYMEEIVALGKAQGYVQTVLGRRRYLPDLNSRRWQERSFAERTAMNTPIQGSAADIIKLAMIRVHKRLRDEGLRTRILLQVHDELLLEAPHEELADAAAIVREEMEGAYSLDVPLKVDIGAGDNWLDIEELHNA